MSESDKHVGVVGDIEDWHSIVVIFMKADEGWISPIFFDHRSFAHLLEAEGCTRDGLIGRRITYDNELVRIHPKH